MPKLTHYPFLEQSHGSHVPQAIAWPNTLFARLSVEKDFQALTFLSVGATLTQARSTPVKLSVQLNAVEHASIQIL